MELSRNNLMAFINTEVARKSAKIKAQLGKRKRNAYSWNELEREAGASKDTVRDFMRAKATVLRADKFQKIAHSLGYDVVLLPRVEQ